MRLPSWFFQLYLRWLSYRSIIDSARRGIGSGRARSILQAFGSKRSTERRDAGLHS